MVFNPRALKKGDWPVLVHRGRKSGTIYRTPLDAFEVGDGYLFIINYGSRSDWPRNVVAAGAATLVRDGEEIALTNPRLLPVNEGFALLPADAKKPPSWVGVDQCLLMEPVRVST